MDVYPAMKKKAKNTIGMSIDRSLQILEVKSA